MSLNIDEIRERTRPAFELIEYLDDGTPEQTALTDCCNTIAELAMEVVKFRTPRTITTREELAALPVATVLRDEVTAIWEKWEPTAYGAKNWRQVGDDYHWTGNDIVLPATVLFTPSAPQQDG